MTDTRTEAELQRYWNPQGGGIEPHDAGLLYLRDDVDAVIAALAAERNALRAEVERLRAENDRLALPAIDPGEIERAGRRWHGEDHRVVPVRWEPYKPDGARQMKAKGRWQEMSCTGDFWKWVSCATPSNLKGTANA